MYSALSFYYGDLISQVSKFIGDLGTVKRQREECPYVEFGTSILLKSKYIRQIVPDQILLKDRKGKIISLDPIIFYEWFEILWKREQQYGVKRK